ncbi:MAG: hypothetical protein ACOC8E_07785, partial [Planctomycetota bacterium]
MGEDFENALTAEAGEPAEGAACPLADRLAELAAPDDDAWESPQLPESEDAVLRKPPFASGCRTVGLGTGPVSAEAFEGRRGTFDVACAAGLNRQWWIIKDG